MKNILIKVIFILSMHTVCCTYAVQKEKETIQSVSCHFNLLPLELKGKIFSFVKVNKKASICNQLEWIATIANIVSDEDYKKCAPVHIKNLITKLRDTKELPEELQTCCSYIDNIRSKYQKGTLIHNNIISLNNYIIGNAWQCGIPLQCSRTLTSTIDHEQNVFTVGERDEIPIRQKLSSMNKVLLLVTNPIGTLINENRNPKLFASFMLYLFMLQLLVPKDYRFFGWIQVISSFAKLHLTSLPDLFSGHVIEIYTKNNIYQNNTSIQKIQAPDFGYSSNDLKLCSKGPVTDRNGFLYLKYTKDKMTNYCSVVPRKNYTSLVSLLKDIKQLPPELELKPGTVFKEKYILNY